MRTIKGSAVLVVKRERLLLVRKFEESLGKYRWKPLSGELLSGESPIEGAKREAYEESGLEVRQLEPCGELRCFFEGKQEEWIIYLFATSSFEGELRSSEEGIVRWFPIDELPYDEMWTDDKHWLPHVLDGKKVVGSFHFDADGSKLLDFSLKIE